MNRIHIGILMCVALFVPSFMGALDKVKTETDVFRWKQRLSTMVEELEEASAQAELERINQVHPEFMESIVEVLSSPDEDTKYIISSMNKKEHDKILEFIERAMKAEAPHYEIKKLKNLYEDVSALFTNTRAAYWRRRLEAGLFGGGCLLIGIVLVYREFFSSKRTHKENTHKENENKNG